MNLPPLPEPLYPGARVGFGHVSYRVWTEPEVREIVAAAVLAEREACAKVCDATPPHPFRPSIEAAHAIRARGE